MPMAVQEYRASGDEGTKFIFSIYPSSGANPHSIP